MLSYVRRDCAQGFANQACALPQRSLAASGVRGSMATATKNGVGEQVD